MPATGKDVMTFTAVESFDSISRYTSPTILNKEEAQLKYAKKPVAGYQLELDNLKEAPHVFTACQAPSRDIKIWATWAIF
ncbi:hypothetical protein ACU8KH_00111 [Lachancea thermotolerans]